MRTTATLWFSSKELMFASLDHKLNVTKHFGFLKVGSGLNEFQVISSTSKELRVAAFEMVWQEDWCVWERGVLAEVALGN